MNKRICMFPGSFDPVTNGHMDIICRAARLFDEVIVAVMINPDKKGCFTREKRVDMLQKACTALPNVRIVSSDGLTAQLANEMGVCALVRGVRNLQDFESESDMAHINGMLVEGLETVFLPASVNKSDISSSFVRQLASFGADISTFVPAEVLEDITSVFLKK